MKRTSVVLTAALIVTAGSIVFAQNATQPNSTVLYSHIKYPNERKNFCLNFPAAAPHRGCDLLYGNLYTGDEHDWFETTISGANRNVIRDLGPHEWTEEITVPIVEPLAELKPGEQRTIGVDTSGKDGEDGAPGAPGANGADADGVVRDHGRRSEPAAPKDLPPPSRPKRDGKTKVTAPFVKAVAGHMYVIHVVDDSRDFYALFRVDAVTWGDNCTVSWRLIPAPKI